MTLTPAQYGTLIVVVVVVAASVTPDPVATSAKVKCQPQSAANDRIHTRIARRAHGRKPKPFTESVENKLLSYETLHTINTRRVSPAQQPSVVIG